ncbi:MAG: 30S ribosomal protein S7 [Candidatus Pacebacteria bacterium]|nr:30S ribosomal protein S7 [Candidatus Paceibacterota bacterium]
MRKKRVYRKNYKPDPKFQSIQNGRFINYIMQEGKKDIATKIFYDMLDFIKKQTKEEGIAIFEKALLNITPEVEVGTKRVGGANYQVPKEVRPERKFMLAARWIIAAARAKKGKPIAERLAEEIILASKNEGSAIKKKLDTHRMAEANRAFAHFSW